MVKCSLVTMNGVSGSSQTEQLPLQLCVVGEELGRDQTFLTECRGFQVPVVLSRNGEEWLDDSSVLTVFVVAPFSGPVFQRLVSCKRPILGPPAVRELRGRGEALLVKRSPVFCLSLYGCDIVISGFRRKSEVERLLRLVHWCGGSVQKDAGTKMTQLVAAHSIGDKYQYATTFSIPVLTEHWLAAAWDRREDLGYRADTKETMEEFRLQLFAGNRVYFYGFVQSELSHMQEVLEANGGQVAGGLEDIGTTHLVVDDDAIEAMPVELEVRMKEIEANKQKTRCDVVKRDWFWRSIQIEAAANPSNYRVTSPGAVTSPTKPMLSPGSTQLDNIAVSSSNKRRKRRQQEMLHLLARESPVSKRRSSVIDLTALNMSGSLLDATESRTVESQLEGVSITVTPESSPGRNNITTSTPTYGLHSATGRQQVFHEFVTTETNYVAILECITKIAKETEDPTQKGGALLDQQEIKLIFGMLAPIRKVHSEMLTKLVWAEDNWCEAVTVGSIILQFAGDLLEAYPPFVNFFERTKSQIHASDQRNVRFHAFLKMCERRPECWRQTLPELMIRPVQRLPSISLLLTDLLKHTKREDPTHPDCEELEIALSKIKEVMNHLNEEKRRTEGQIHIFDIYSEIENCPASVVSSHRSFVTRADCVELASEHQFCGKGYELTLFLFTDILVVAKRKSTKSLGSISRSHSTNSSSHVTGPRVRHNSLVPNKMLKFVAMIQLSSVRRLVDVFDAEDCEEMEASNFLAIVCRLTEDLRERMYLIKLALDCKDDNIQFVRLLCRQVANTRCKQDPEELLARMAACQLGIESSDLSVTSFSKVISSFQKTKQKVGRAFSFNKTPIELKISSNTISPMTLPRLNTSSERWGGKLKLDLEAEQQSTSSIEETIGQVFLSEGQNLHLSDTDSMQDWNKNGTCSVPDITSVHPTQARSLSVTELSNNPGPPLISKKTPQQSCVSLLEKTGFSPRWNKSISKKSIIKVDETSSPINGENADPTFFTRSLERLSFKNKFRTRSRTNTIESLSWKQH